MVSLSSFPFLQNQYKILPPFAFFTNIVIFGQLMTARREGNTRCTDQAKRRKENLQTVNAWSG